MVQPSGFTLGSCPIFSIVILLGLNAMSYSYILQKTKRHDLVVWDKEIKLVDFTSKVFKKDFC